ncbi:MAG TPA: hypothetical protein VJS38_01405 [Phenylobacterium sp.]|uniref:hypothetical protein n=1 Tax=Phenylobacterium sp. TaxID=1871053 RepID=UPI002B4624C2|nr:hypothetical protein [Phenylobacterium sp.]HKR86807.1 hypothetical protein [Phenylobacterium sp.]
MTLAELVVLTLKSSVALMVFSVGLGTQLRELTALLRSPAKLVGSLVSMNLVMLAIALAIALLLPLRHSVQVMLIALALSPVPPLLPRKLMQAGGGHDYVMALLFSASVFAIFWIPFAGGVLDRIFPADVRIPAGPVIKLVSMTVLGPTLAGVVVRRAAPGLAARLEAPLGKVAGVLLLLGLALVLAKAAPLVLAQLGDGTLLAIVAFVGLGLLVGQRIGGPSPGDRSALALATACRHPGVAMGIAHLTFPGEKGAPAALLLYLIVSAILTVPYVAWRRRVLAKDASLAATPAG